MFYLIFLGLLLGLRSVAGYLGLALVFVGAARPGWGGLMAVLGLFC